MRRGRHKGAKPVDFRALPRPPISPVRLAVDDGDPWVEAWINQRMPRRRCVLTRERLWEINEGDTLTRAELQALADWWDVDVEEVIGTLPSPDLLRD